MSGRGGQFWRHAGRSARHDLLCLPSFVIFSLVGLALAGCQVPQSRLAQSPAKPKAVTAAAPAPALALAPVAEVPQPPKPTPLAAIPAVAHDVAPLGPMPHLTGDPAELVGLDNATVRRVLGDPQRIRNDHPAQVWQYATGDCIVDLYLYSRGGAMTVTYVEARSHTAETAPTARCLKSLLERPTASAS